jgi:DNA primase
MLLHTPELAMKLPLEALPPNSAEARAIRGFCEAIRAAGEPVPAYPVLLERLRGSEDEAMLREAASELMQQPFDDEAIGEEFEGAVRQLQEAERKRVFAALQAKVTKLGVAGLSGEEKQQYLQVLSTRS